MNFSLKATPNLNPQYVGDDTDYLLRISKDELKNMLANDRQEYCKTVSYILEMFCAPQDISHGMDDDELVGMIDILNDNPDANGLIFAVEPVEGRLKLVVGVEW